MRWFINLFLISNTTFAYAYTSVSMTESVNPYSPNCRRAFSFNFKVLKEIPEGYSEVINEPSVQRNVVADYTERVAGSVVKCGYVIEREIGLKLAEDVIYAKKCFQHISGKALVFVQYDNDKTNSITVDANGKKKNTVYILNDKFYVWELGVCTPEAEVFFENVSTEVKIQDLKRKGFLEVTVSGDEKNVSNKNTDFKMFYANPGFLIKTKQCNQSDKCKKGEVLVVYKKILSDAILRKNNMLLTTDNF